MSIRLAALPLGTVRPEGWLASQLRVQAAGLTGSLDQYWPDLGPGNAWAGGAGSGEGSWERAPYYVDGLVPLAHLLGDEHLIAKATWWIDAMLSTQRPDGWIGPVEMPPRRAHDLWPVAIACKTLAQHYEATRDERVPDALAKTFAWIRTNLDRYPLTDWSRFRWADLALSILWLHDLSQEGWLLDVALSVRRQGYDWRAHFDDFRHLTKVDRWAHETHVVNNTMALKAGAVAWRLTGDPGDLAAVQRAMDVLDRYHGNALGTINGDECYAGLDPSQGTELCGVAEHMYSLEQLIALTGKASYADRLESIAFNALPGTFTPDMFAHQYDQQTNQVLCSDAERAWTTNGPQSNLFGLEPNFGCCTANMHQGWPKLVSSMWHRTSDGGYSATVLGPSSIVDGDVHLHTDTRYPFGETLRITVLASRSGRRLPIHVRIPAWADGATVDDATAVAGSLHRVERAWRVGDTIHVRLPMEPRFERRAGTVVRLGPLVMGLRIREAFRKVGEHDYAVEPASPWNFALVEDHPMSVEWHDVPALPFDPELPAVMIRAQARRVPSWGLQSNSAGPVPQGAPTAARTEDVELIPYGSTHLRVTEFPTTVI